MKKILEQLGPWLLLHWLTIVLVILLIISIALLGWWIWNKFGKRIQGWWAELIRRPEISRTALIDIWSHFHRSLPLTIRTVVRNYPIYIVLGDDRSGKSTLINNHVDPDFQDLRHHTVDAENPLMRISMGYDAVICEISAGFLYATSRDYVDALLAFWIKLPIDTKVVMAVDAHAFTNSSEELQKKIVDALVGKLSLLTEIKGSPVGFNLALTHMDRTPGFAEFYSFSEETGIGLDVTLSSGTTIPTFSTGLAHYIDYLPNVLVSRSSSDFESILRFFNLSRDILYLIESLFIDGAHRNNLAYAQLERVTLNSDVIYTLHNSADTNNPFYNQALIRKPFDFITKKHLKRSGLLFIVLFIIQQYTFWHDRSVLQSSAYYISILSSLTPSEYIQKAHPVFVDLNKLYQDLASSNPIRSFKGSYYMNEIDKLDYMLSKAIRTTYLLPRLELAQTHENSYKNTIRFMALLHANDKNELSNYFSNSEFDSSLNLPYEIEQDYIHSNNNLDDDQLKNLSLKDYGFSGGNIATKPWSSLTEALELAVQDEFISPQELETIQLYARNTESIYNEMALYPYLDEQKLWLQSNGHVSPFTIEIWKSVPTQSDFAAPNLKQVLALIENASITYSERPTSILDCFYKIQSIMEDYKSNVKSSNYNLGIIRIPLGTDFYSFDSNKWNEVVYRSTIKQLLISYYRSNIQKDGWIFFNPQNTTYRIQLGVSSDELGVLLNNAQVDTRLTREAFDQQVKPAINLLTTLLPDLPLAQEDKQELIDFFVSNLTVYSGKYANAYWDFFKNIIVRITGPENLKSFLREIQRPGSAFTQNLVRIKESVLLDIPAGPNYQPVRDRLEDFRFMDKLMQEQAGSYPQLARFVTIVTEMSDQLDKDSTPPLTDKKNADTNGLMTLLSPMGRVSYDMLLQNEGSYLHRAEVFLRDLNIPVNWQTPFLTPFLKAREYGRAEIISTIASSWTKLWSTTVSPMLNYYPFAIRESALTSDLNPSSLKAVFHPNNGIFWNEVRAYYSSLFDIKEGKWKLRSEISSVLQIPDDMESKLNAASSLTIAMWDKDGNETPIHFNVKAGLLPVVKPSDGEDAEETPVSLSFLKSGSTSVLGFNQKDIWQDLSFEWWQKLSSSVGVELPSQKKEASKKYLSVDVDDANWSLLHLLSQSDSANSSTYTWVVAQPQNPKHKMNVVFTFKRNPFELFTALRNK